MLWLYERDRESIRLETRYDNDARDYVVVLHYPDGRQLTERFPNPDACRDWLLSLENNLDAEHWIRRGPPMILPDGWPRPKR
jgi:hypothetical protein